MIAVYMRYSSEQQTGNMTIETQLRCCREFIERESSLPNGRVAEYKDEAISGGAFANRPGYMDMEDAARRGKLEVIVVYKYDRLGRSLLDTLKAIKRLARYGVRVLSATEPDNELLRNMLLTMAEGYASQLADRTRDGLIQVVQEGFHAGGKPYGYRLKKVADPKGRTDKDGKPVERTTLELDPYEAAVVRRIFSRYRSGFGFKAITAALNDDDIASPRGGTWDATAVRHIIRSELYSGLYRFNQRRMVKDHETGTRIAKRRPKSEQVLVEHPEWCIIPDALYRAVRERLAEVERLAKGRCGGAGDKRATGRSAHLLTGMVQCGVCFEKHGGRMTVQNSRYMPKDGSPERVTSYMRCNRHGRRGDAVCTNSTGGAHGRDRGGTD